MKRYSLQHNGLGKIHLADENNNCICGSNSKNMLHVMAFDMIVENNVFHEIYNDISVIVHNPYDVGYCKRCVRQAGIKLTH